MGKLYDAEPTLRLASLAMSASVTGHHNHDSQLIVKGLKAYSEPIREMTRAVADDSRKLGDGLLATTCLMEFYEVCSTIPKCGRRTDCHLNSFWKRF